MIPRPTFWHRTRRRPSFWLGLFVVCFLAWAWWVSYDSGAMVLYAWGKRAFAIIHRNGASCLLTARPWSGRRLEWQYSNWLYTEEVLQNWSLAEELSYLRVPDSLVFFSFVGVWVGWLAFPEWLRKRRSNDSA
jgi:hypothetical protein